MCRHLARFCEAAIHHSPMAKQFLTVAHMSLLMHGCGPGVNSTVATRSSCQVFLSGTQANTSCCFSCKNTCDVSQDLNTKQKSASGLIINTAHAEVRYWFPVVLPWCVQSFIGNSQHAFKPRQGDWFLPGCDVARARRRYTRGKRATCSSCHITPSIFARGSPSSAHANSDC